MEESKNTRIAFALLCGLAVCCSVMYITSDGGEAIMEDAKHSTGSGQDVFDPASVDSTDVMKTGLLYTKTPDTIKAGPEGRQRLLTFLDKVEANIAKEVESRKADIAAIRAKMAKNMEFNAAARKKMKKMLLAKMAVNAKKAKDDLTEAMRQTQQKFAEAAELENKRNKTTKARSRKTRELMRKNKKQGAHELKQAVDNQQRALSTLASVTQAKIDKTNKHIAANAAQIKENAKKARQDLDNAMESFDNKMSNVQEEAQKGRSKLAAQAAAQDKKFREFANNKIKAIAAKTAAEFHEVRDKMAKDRAKADSDVAALNAKMIASLQASKALQDKRFASTVSDIAAAKKEANDRVEGFKTSFKTSTLHLAGIVEEQSKKMNARVDQLSATVRSNKLNQADVNNKVSAELKRMAKVGNDRYSEQLDKDAELKALMAKNKAAAEEHMDEMSNKFFEEVDKIKTQMKKDRAHAESALTDATSKLYETIEANTKAQAAVNKALTEETRRVMLDSEAALKEAKDGFATKISGLHSTVKKLAKKHSKGIEDLTGVVQENAIKDLDGRNELHKIAEFNHNLLKTAVADAVHKGEQRALQIEAKMTKENKKTREQMNSRITTEISGLRKAIHGQISELTLETKEARAAMRKEMIFAIKSAEEVAKQNLADTVKWAEGEFSKLHAGLAATEKEGAEARAGLKATVVANKDQILTQLAEAVAAQEKALLAYRHEMCEEAGVMSGVIKNGEHVVTAETMHNCGGGKTNKKLQDTYELMLANSKEVGEKMDANSENLKASLAAAKSEADEQLGAADAASVKRYDDTIEDVVSGIEKATEASNKRFAEAYSKMAQDAMEVKENLSGAVSDLNDKIAKAAALEDARFSKTVKMLAEAKAEAHREVTDAKHKMAASMVLVNAKLKEVESRVTGAIQVVSGAIISEKASQHKINVKVEKQMAALVKKSDDSHSEDKKARGVIKKIMDENKALAAEEVKNLAKEAAAAIESTENAVAAHLQGFKDDLGEATKKLYSKLAADDKAQKEAMKALHGELDAAKMTTSAALKDAKAVFASRVTTLTNAITANQKYYEDKMSEHTGIVMNWKEASDADREAIRDVRDAMVANLHTDIANAITKAEAEIKAVEETAMLNIAKEKRALLTTISESVENMADNVFVTVQENRAKIADNYLSLKAYAATAADAITDYLQKGKGRNLSSIGDLLNTLAGMSDVQTAPAAGEGFGGDTIPAIFSGEEVKVDSSISKINGLVNEYVSTVGQVKERWPLGLGKYLIAKLEIAMQGDGALEVDKIEGKAGNYVFMNAHSVGLSSKLSDFEDLACQMNHYESKLSEMTGNLPKTKTAAKVYAKPPEWEGN